MLIYIDKDTYNILIKDNGNYFEVDQILANTIKILNKIVKQTEFKM